jgi:hypothetical protein
METVLISTRSPEGSSSASSLVSRSGPASPTSALRNDAVPISTSTSYTPSPLSPTMRTPTMPPGVSTVNAGPTLTRPISSKYAAKMRMPLPLFSASLPSGLKMRSPKSAAALPTPARIPSDPTPVLRSQNRRTAGGVRSNGSASISSAM